jgi:hypothetical protein
MQTYAAQRFTTCANCEAPIRIGDLIARLAGVGYVHRDCPQPSVLTAVCGGWTTTAGHACHKPAKPGERCAQHAGQRVKTPQRRRAGNVGAR